MTKDLSLDELKVQSKMYVHQLRKQVANLETHIDTLSDEEIAQAIKKIKPMYMQAKETITMLGNTA